MLETDLGFDATINDKTDDIDQALDRLCPDGINIYFDNVGGTILDACLDRLALHARIVLCGGISHYNLGTKPSGPSHLLTSFLGAQRCTVFCCPITQDYSMKREIN